MGDSRVQEKYSITSGMRAEEGYRAMKSLDIPNLVWSFRDDRPEWDDIHTKVVNLRDGRIDWDTVWAPLWEEDGHSQHNLLSECVSDVFGDRVRFYATYRRGSARTRTETEVTPEPHWPALKFKAMACYESQINLPNCQPWFAADDMLREWVA